ncbi:MAG: 4-alpha-glucanotransferase [Elusimicrobia bacterium]|nr:4-alpha-glucanotransferase [Elusimicrobiota bacterium]
MTGYDYQSFLQSPSRPHWDRVGLNRRAGVCAPLFSLHTKESVGIGEIPDLKPFVDWCAGTGLSIIQLLPLNDVGYDFAPYSAKSSFALDPMYLSLRNMAGVDTDRFEPEIQNIAERFPIGGRVNYGIKGAKMDLLWRMFTHRDKPEDSRFQLYRRRTAYWLRDDALFKILKQRFQGASWEQWPDPYRDRKATVLDKLVSEERDSVRFHEWLQWQLYEQFLEVKAHAKRRGVLLMGDMPFLVARDSADVWAHPNYFRLDLSAGAPPDLYFAGGQRWGMPAYNWPALARGDYDYLERKLRYAENFYDMYRIDHVIGVFRLYTIPLSSPADRGGLDGVFEPKDERGWEQHGRRLLEVMLESTRMLPCGEDLGVVPACSYKVLRELSIPGLDVQRWARDWGKTYGFNSPGTYRPNAVAVCSTHDMSIVAAWWQYEVATVDDYFLKIKCETRKIPYEPLKEKLFVPDQEAHGRLHWRPEIDSEEVFLKAVGLGADEAGDFLDVYRSTRWEREKFWNFLGMEGKPTSIATPDFVRRALEKAGETASVFSIQLLQDWLYAGGGLEGQDVWTARVNLPGSVADTNWSYVVPLSVDSLLSWSGNADILEVNKKTGRCP